MKENIKASVISENLLWRAKTSKDPKKQNSYLDISKPGSSYDNLGFTPYQEKLKSIFVDMEVYMDKCVRNKTHSTKKNEVYVGKLMSQFLDTYMENCIFDFNSDIVKELFQTNRNKKIGISIVDDEIKVTDISKFQKHITKHVQRQIFTQLEEIFLAKIDNDVLREDISISDAMSKARKVYNKNFKFSTSELKKIIYIEKVKFFEINDLKPTNSGKNKKLKTNKKNNPDIIIYGPPKPSQSVLLESLQKTAFRLNDEHGYKLDEILTDKTTLETYKDIIHKDLDIQIEEISSIYSNNSRFNRNEIKQAQNLLKYVTHTIGNVNSDNLNLVKKLAQEEIKTEIKIKTDDKSNDNLEKIIENTSIDEKEIVVTNYKSKIPFEDLNLNNLSEVTEYILKRYGDSINFTDKVKKQTKKCVFENHKQVYNALTCLATSFLEKLSNPSENWHKNELNDLIKTETDSTFEYAPRHNKVVVNAFPKDYKIEYERETLTLHKHLKCGAGYGNKNNMIRICFEYVKKNNKIVIGFMDTHPGYFIKK